VPKTLGVSGAHWGTISEHFTEGKGSLSRISPGFPPMISPHCDFPPLLKILCWVYDWRLDSVIDAELVALVDAYIGDWVFVASDSFMDFYNRIS